MLKTLRPLLILAFMICVGQIAIQAQPGGGRINAEPKPSPKTTPKTTPKPEPGKPAKETVRTTTSGGLDRIDGKWWTTGNGFGDSEVIFTQNGSRISGVINWADGRSGSVTGNLVAKRMTFNWSDGNGNGGAGWLELSWANFLGGPRHNQQVRDGSWTMNRIEGKWCLGGKRERLRVVTHNATGKLKIVTEDGTEEEGHMEGPWIYLDSEFGPIKGDMFYKGNRVDFANGQFWTWCGR